jgi:Asp-tRNA(Asn)/Glu-tRNA(Gln) amidotransferase C subunit
MSEERLERIENQLSQVLRVVIGLQEDQASLRQEQDAMRQNQDALREDMVSLRNRINSIDSTVRLAIAEGFRSQELYYDDLNADLARNERQTRRLNRRVDRLERLDGEQ